MSGRAIMMVGIALLITGGTVAGLAERSGQSLLQALGVLVATVGVLTMAYEDPRKRKEK